MPHLAWEHLRFPPHEELEKCGQGEERGGEGNLLCLDPHVDKTRKKLTLQTAKDFDLYLTGSPAEMSSLSKVFLKCQTPEHEPL